jgi:hypothetical protein
MEMWGDDLAHARDHLGMAFARSRSGETVHMTQGIGFLAECEYRLGLLGKSSVHAELAVGVKTVEYHISNIYRRLGINSRVKLAQPVGAEL